MKIVECSGSPRRIGRAAGEALREEIRHNLEIAPAPGPNWERRLRVFVDVMKQRLPRVLEELQATAEGANLPAEEIYRLNFPAYANELDLDEGCTNLAFADGPDGPLWGKNNDGGHADASKRLRPCARIVKPDRGVPLVMFTFAGMLITDGMNAEGLAVGHSSVGSVFQQSDRHPPIRPWMYDAMMQARTVADYVARMTAAPLRGKGYSILCVDRAGAMCSIEAACPLVQVRRPASERGMNCVNCYQLPALRDADRRSPEGKANALARRRFLEEAVAAAPTLDLDAMKRLLRHHGEPSICRHGESSSYTEYSMIGLPQAGRVLFADGYPCEREYQELTI